jgi:transglutaminase/protease-like cytokinesis protein 3
VAVDIQKTLDLLAKIQKETQDTKVKEPLARILADLRAYLQEQEDARNKLTDALHQSEAARAELNGKIADLEKQNAAQAKQIADLTRRLEAASGGSSANSSTPLGLASSFKKVIDTIQAEARSTPGMATTVKSMDIELKGLVQVQADNTTVMVLPAEKSAIDPNSLSTLRVTFGAIPVAVAAAAPAPPVTSTPAAPPTRPAVEPAIRPIIKRPSRPPRPTKK